MLDRQIRLCGVRGAFHHRDGRRRRVAILFDVLIVSPGD